MTMRAMHEDRGPVPGSQLATDALETFPAVHRAGTITGAAAALAVSQPAVTRRLQALERTLGVPLFDRVGGRLRLDSAGLALLPHAERVVAAKRDALRAVVDHRDGASGSVEIGIVGSLVQQWFTDVLRAVLSEHRDVELAVTTAASREIHDGVVAGDLTVGISHARSRHPAADLAAGSLAAVDVPEVAVDAPVTMLTRTGTYLGPAASTVIDAIPAIAAGGPPQA